MRSYRTRRAPTPHTEVDRTAVALGTEPGRFAPTTRDWFVPDSYELGFHETQIPRFFFDLRNGTRSTALMSKPRLERAIGVIYRPDTERISHYFRADMPRQFDGVYHLDETRAVEPLEKPERWHDVEPPETYPSGI